jgi:ribosomal protein L7/L12
MMLTPESFGLIALVLLGVILLASVGARVNGMQNRMGVLSRVEAKLDLLLKQANIKFDPYANVSREIAEAVRGGQKIKAIKLYRQSSGVGLKEAKEFIEEVQRRGGVG